MQINAAEEDMLALKARYEQSVKDRNTVGMNLLDRNDELCILYERLNIQKEVMAKGEAGLSDKEDEIRKLQLIVNELKRKLELQKRAEPLVTQYQLEITRLENEREQSRERCMKLAKQMENPDDPNRLRNLSGTDPNKKELLKKIGALEDMLSVRNEKILEKDLILEEIATLTSRLKKQTLDGKDETYHITRTLNDITKRMKSVTRSMMAKVSELAMHQALAMSLYQEKTEKEALLDEAKMRLQTGDIPTEHIERDFIRTEKARMLRDQKIRELKLKKQKEESGMVEV